MGVAVLKYRYKLEDYLKLKVNQGVIRAKSFQNTDVECLCFEKLFFFFGGGGNVVLQRRRPH